MPDSTTTPFMIETTDLHVDYPTSKGIIRAVSGVNLQVEAGSSLGLVGESGCGKSTLARTIAMLQKPVSGRVVLNGADLGSADKASLRRVRRQFQMIFQDPISTLDPRRTVADIVEDPLRIWGRSMGLTNRAVRREKVAQMLDAVGMSYEEHGARKPSDFSGGQCQRISIARALILEPTVLVCDEPVSALDVSVQAQILNILRRMKREMKLTTVFISHDLPVVKNICERIAVMYLGRICETGSAEQISRHPRHPYTAALISSIPEIPRPSGDAGPAIPRVEMQGELPSPMAPPSGCRFRTRCPLATEVCAQVDPPLAPLPDSPPGHQVACHHPIDLITREVYSSDVQQPQPA